MKSVLMAGVAGLIALACTASVYAAPPSDKVTAALADKARPSADGAREPLRHPGELIRWAGIKPGDRVADYFPGGGYYDRILSDVVGAKGKVYGFIPAEMARNCDPSEFAGSREIADEKGRGNFVILQQPLTGFVPPQRLDVVWSSQNFHDLYDKFMDHADVAQAVGAVYRALKPGGVFIVIDHVAQSGSGLRDTESLHRIDPAAIRKQVEAAGFVYAGQSDVLRNPADDHRLKVFDPKIRGRTDQVAFKFRKPVA